MSVLSSLLLSSRVVAILKYQYHLLYQPLFLSFSCASCYYMSIYPTAVFLRTTIEIKLHSFFVLSLPSHHLQNFFTTIFNFNEFRFVYVSTIRFIFDSEYTYLLTHSLIHTLTHSLTHSLTYSLTNSLIHSLTHSLI